MNKLKEILKEEIEIYKSWKSREDIDVDSLCYDEAYQLFQDRGKCQEIMEELIK